MPKAKRSDWKAEKMPSRREPFSLEMDLTPEELERLQQGHIPEEMEDKWFLFWESGIFYACRSWTGYCIYEIPVSPEGTIRGGLVNRDPEQYTETSLRRDEIMAKYLVIRQIGRPGTRELMLEYIKAGKEKQQ